MDQFLDLGWEREICKMCPEHLVVPESKTVLENTHTHTHNGGMSKAHRSQQKELPMTKAGKPERQNKVVLVSSTGL